MESAKLKAMVLSDGFRGFRLGDYGLGYPNLPAFSATAYERVGEEKILRQPHPLNFELKWRTKEGRDLPVTRLNLASQEGTLEVVTEGIAESGELTIPFRAVTQINRDGGQLSYSILVGTPLAVPVFPGLTKVDDAVYEYVEPGSFVTTTREVKALLDIESDDPWDSNFVRLAAERLQWELPKQPTGLPPMGLTSDLYFGHTFWDADVWMMPVLSWIAPDSARALATYRINRFAQAQKNFDEWQAAGCPIGKGTLDRSGVRLSGQPAMYPWESSVSGRETVPGPSRFQHHITGSVVFGLQQAADFGLLHPTTLQKVGTAAAEFFTFRSDEIQPGLRGIRGTMSPDEFHTGDNDLYTNVLAEQVVQRYLQKDWRAYRPRDATTFLTYDGDRLKEYKQAAALLAVYPLQDPAAEKEASKMLERFAGKVIKNGPAMSHAIDATVRARFGDVEQAYKEWRQSWVPYTTDGDMFREKASSTKDRTYFYTGAAGALQTVIYGFGGARISPTPTNSKDEIKLPSGRYLTFKPRLPKSWQKISLTDIKIGAKTYDFILTNGNAQISSRGN